jgi:ribose transport system permease protein
MQSIFNRIKKWTALPGLVLFLIFFIIYIGISGTFNLSFINLFISTNAPAIVVAIGVATTILIGGIDISLGSIVTLTNVIIVTLVGRNYSIISAVLLALLFATAAGAFNGFLIGVMRINPLLTTFSTATVFSGIALWLLPYPGGTIPYSFSDWYNSGLLNFIPMPIVMIAIPFLIWLLATKLPFGVKIYALGRNAKKAYASGIGVSGIRFFTHTFAGFSAGIAGLCISASMSAGNPTVGATMSTNSIAAAVIGGISLSGGIGGVWGAMFGAMFLNILISIIVSANMSSYVQSFVQGIILLFGIICTIIASNKEIKNKIYRLWKRGARRNE